MVDKKKTKKGPSGAKASRTPTKKKARATAKPAKAARVATRAPEKAAPDRRSKAPRAARPPQPKAQVVVASGPPPMGIHDLRPASGATHSKKRVGRGPGSGHGKTAGRGSKGQKSRSGYRHMRGFEGGQMPLHRRVPKRGFTNIFRVEYDVVNLSALDRFESGTKVTPDVLASHRLARRSRPVKILGDGQIGKPLEVSAHKFSAGAQAKIEAAGGRCEVIPR
jgi:large subunit ribosomal protein L15